MKKPLEKVRDKVKSLPNSSVKEGIISDIDKKLKNKTVVK